jgi:hypothetical protein
MNNNKNFGLPGLHPVYGQVIASSPTWAGPFEAPDIPGPIDVPILQTKSTGSTIASIGASIIAGGMCAALAPSGFGLLACPIIADVTRQLISDNSD